MPYSPRNVQIAFNHRGLTHFGGVHLFDEFLRVLHFRNFLAQQIRYPRRNREYSVSQMLLALVYPIVLGLDRIETASLLRSNGTFQYLTGLPSFPDPQTLRRFLLNAPAHLREQLHRANDRMLQRFIHLPEHRRCWADCRTRSCAMRFSRIPPPPKAWSICWRAYLQRPCNSQLRLFRHVSGCMLQLERRRGE